MRRKEFENLKIGDLVTPNRGRLKGQIAKVTKIDIDELDPTWGPFVAFVFLDPECRKVHMKYIYTGDLSYRALDVVK